MKITRKKNQNQFAFLRCGEVFKYCDQIYMKIEDCVNVLDQERVNAANVTNGLTIFIDGNCTVEVLDCEVVVYET